MALVFCLFVGIGGGVMRLLGQPPIWPVFTGLGCLLVLWMLRRATKASSNR